MSGRSHSRFKRQRPQTSQWFFSFTSLLAVLVTFVFMNASKSPTGKTAAQVETKTKADIEFEFQKAIALVRLKEKLERPLFRLIEDKQAELVDVEGGFLIRIRNDALFPPRALTLRREVLTRMRAVASLLGRVPNVIHVVGHVDKELPPAKAPFQNNRSLSAAYAAALVDFLVVEGEADVNRFWIGGTGQYMLWESHASERGTIKDRHIEIQVTPKYLSVAEEGAARPASDQQASSAQETERTFDPYGSEASVASPAGAASGMPSNTPKRRGSSAGY